MGKAIQKVDIYEILDKLKDMDSHTLPRERGRMGALDSLSYCLIAAAEMVQVLGEILNEVGTPSYLYEVVEGYTGNE